MMHVQLLKWFDAHKRTMPWREQPIPYYVWVSEIMLQQTQVSVVIPYFERFIKELPTIEALAQADEELFLRLWQGLGYYSRVMNLQKAARIVQDQWQGELPQEKDELMTLPGIGDYTAGAISSIAYGKVATAIDGNVLRVYTRLYDDDGDITKVATKRRVDAYVMDTMDKTRPGDFNQSIMELGALVCTPKNPKCNACPVADDCKARANGTQLLRPVKPQKKKSVEEEKTVLVIRADKRVIVQKRPNKGLLKNLWQYTLVDAHLTEKEAVAFAQEQGHVPLKIKQGPTYKHIFSHRIWNIVSFIIDVEETTGKHTWAVQDRLEEYAIPSAFSLISEWLENEV